jgi:uncharacterized membrane protein YkoI
MEVNMTRRKILLMTAGATVLGLAALVGFADGKSFEAVVNHATGKVLKIEPITEGDDLAAANAQSAAMAKTKTSLKEAVDKAMAQSANARAISVVPSLKDGRPMVSVVLLDGEQVKTVQQPLD